MLFCLSQLRELSGLHRFLSDDYGDPAGSWDVRGLCCFAYPNSVNYPVCTVFYQMIMGTPPVLDVLRKSIKFPDLGIRASPALYSGASKLRSSHCAQFCAHHQTLPAATEHRPDAVNVFWGSHLVPTTVHW
jgi:hypothetical protein